MNVNNNVELLESVTHQSDTCVFNHLFILKSEFQRESHTSGKQIQPSQKTDLQSPPEPRRHLQNQDVTKPSAQRGQIRKQSDVLIGCKVGEDDTEAHVDFSL